jgi:hypothetical protein
MESPVDFNTEMNEDEFIITDKWIINNKTPGGGYNRKQLNILGIEWPPKFNWKLTLVGKKINKKVAKEFENLAMTGNKSEKKNIIQEDKSEIAQLKKDVKEIKESINKILELMNAVYQFETTNEETN